MIPPKEPLAYRGMVVALIQILAGYGLIRSDMVDLWDMLLMGVIGLALTIAWGRPAVTPVEKVEDAGMKYEPSFDRWVPTRSLPGDIVSDPYYKPKKTAER